MKEEIRLIEKDGKLFEVPCIFYGEEDKPALIKTYAAWRYYSDLCVGLKNRRPNIPEAISETAFCIATGAAKINKDSAPTGFKKAFDCYDFNSKSRIELKSTSSENDLSSFSPEFKSDKYFFMDFYKDGSFLGKFDIYELCEEIIGNTTVNNNQTVYDQQLEKRRPRFSVKNKIIKPYKMKPELTGNIYGGAGNKQRVVFKKIAIRSKKTKTYS